MRNLLKQILGERGYCLVKSIFRMAENCCAKLQFICRIIYCLIRRTSRKKRPQAVIVSLTSFSERIIMKNVVRKALLSLILQSEPADMIILWLAKDEFPNGENDLPKNILSLKKFRLQIRFCEDLRSYKKLLPSLEAFPDDILVTADDDIFYPVNWLKMLLTWHAVHPDSIIAHRGSKIRMNATEILPYMQWDSNAFSGLSIDNFFTGGAGALYPPHCLHGDVSRYDLIQKIAPLSDDLYFWAMAVLNGTKIFAIQQGFREIVDLIPDKVAHNHLYTQNCLEGNNDKAISAILAQYPQLRELLAKQNIQQKIN